jgi:hypothetical protein
LNPRFYYLRHWLAYGLLPIFTTVYLPPWMRLLGAKIGKYAEMSTIWSFIPELLDAGESAFFADGCRAGSRHSTRSASKYAPPSSPWSMRRLSEDPDGEHRCDAS